MRLQDYKQETIKAIEEIIHRYDNPKKYKYLFFNSKQCPLCKLHKKYNVCRGCPLANVQGTIGCIDFYSFKSIKKYRYSIHYEAYLRKRGEFFKKILPIIKQYKFEYFTDIGWRYFATIKREW